MTADQKLLLENLLDRLDADAESKHPEFRRIVSDREREALRSLLTEPATVPQPLEPPPKPLPEPVDEPTPEPADQPIETGGDGEPGTRIELNTKALGYQASPAPEWTLCLDFGTAKSKAFAATDDEEDPELLPLPIGKADGDPDGSVHEVSSSVWIDDDGLLFMGSEAVNRGFDYGNPTRQRLESLKLHLELNYNQLERVLPEKIDPTSTLTYLDAIFAHLAYLTDLATTELESAQGVRTRYMRRRFTLPWWETERRIRAGKLLTNGLACAQLLADTFHGRWHRGIPVDEFKRILRDATVHDEQLRWMVLSEPEGGVLEALAAASARVWSDSSARDVMVVVDVGAGTTDISVFWVVQRTPNDEQEQPAVGLKSFHRAWPIEPCGTAVMEAGNALDRLLVAELIKRANLGDNWVLRQHVTNKLFRERVPRLKEILFETGEITKVLASNHTVKLTREEFIDSENVKKFEQRIVNEIDKLLGGVHESWERAPGRGITFVLTGGGCYLPMIQNLVKKRWKIGNRDVACRLATAVPATVEERFSSEFVQEYPRLTVAMGGALKMRLDERKSLTTWYGGTPSGYSVTDGSDWT